MEQVIDKPRSAGVEFARALWDFGWKQALSCIFPVAFFATLALSKWVAIPFVPRYDFILIAALLIQWALYRSGLETRDEVKVIALFHLFGLLLEIYKIRMGSWAYPEPGYAKVLGVPLYSGFMYASVASFMCQAWRRLDLKLLGWPPAWVTAPLGAAIYLNFFTHHYLFDFRWVLTAALVGVFCRTWVQYTVVGVPHRMPLVLSFVLIGFFVWIAENIATYFGAWVYPHQKGAWTLVHLGKLSSWSLLVIVSFMLVAQLKHVKAARSARE